MSAPLFDLQNVHVAYHGREALRGLSLTIAEGGVTALLGPNGSGKTTLLKVLLGLLKPRSGTVRFRGSDLGRLSRRELARQVAYLPQNHRPVFPYTVEEVAMLGHLPRRGLLTPFTHEDRRRSLACLDALGIAALAGRPYTEISGGERQLTLLARAMVQGAAVHVLDEPESALDFGNQQRLLSRIAELAGQGRTCIFSTHLPDHALAVADRVVLLTGGTVLAAGPTHEVVTAEHLAAMYAVRVRLAHVAEGWRVIPPALVKPASKEGVPK
jgi:iron complex transport system ATP-binding protein